MDRRSFLKLPALLPLINVGSAFRYEPHRFGYESVIGTSMDLLVCSPSSHVAEGACRTILEEIDRLRSILDTRDPASELSRLEGPNAGCEVSSDLREVLDAYEYWSAVPMASSRFIPEVLNRLETSTPWARRTSS